MRKTMFIRVFAGFGVSLVVCVGAAVASPAPWPSFRGPHGSGIADGQNPPVTWDAEQGTNIRWKTPIPGLGALVAGGLGRPRVRHLGGQQQP